MNAMTKSALQYLVNTGESVNADQFDEDHEPIGPSLRMDIAPYVTTDAKGKLKLNDAGRLALNGDKQHG